MAKLILKGAFYPIALRKTKIAYNFGLSECSKVKVDRYALRGSYSTIYFFVFPLKEGLGLVCKGKKISPLEKNIVPLRVNYVARASLSRKANRKSLEFVSLCKMAEKHVYVPIHL